MRRRSVDHLVPNEQRTLRAAWQLQQQGVTEIHGYLLARQLKDRSEGAPVMAYSTVYRCLERLEERGLIASFESSDVASGGPPRRMFTMTERGTAVAAALPPDDSGFDLGDASSTS
ncbi:MAG: PadR family transcriptional regulator [Acidimicrobiales bacterium]